MATLRFFARRIVAALLVMLVVSFLMVLMTHFGPGDAAISRLSENATPADVARVRSELGLDRPLLEQYGSWLASVVRGDFGTSLITGTPVSDSVSQGLATTASLALVALVLSIPILLVAGVSAGAAPGSALDRVVFNGASLVIGLPSFLVGLLLIDQVASRTSLPSFGYTPLSEGFGPWISSLILPGLTLGLLTVGELTRQLRNSTQDVMQREFVRTARGKGLRETTVLRRHVFRNASLPTVTLLGLEVISLLGGSAVVESVFALPGLGRQIVQATLSGDVPVIQAIVLVVAAIAVTVSTAVDLLYRLIDPRIKVA